MPESLAALLALVVTVAPLFTLLLAAWVVGRSAEQAAPSIGLSRVAIADLTTPILATALVIARIVEVLPTWRSMLTNPLDLLRVTGAGQLSPLGGVIGTGLGFLVFTRRKGLPLPRTADLYGLVLPLGIAVYSGGCLLRTDCYGRVAPAPLGIVFPGFEFPHYPVGLYAAAAGLFVYAGLRWFALRQPAPGNVAMAAVTAVAGSYALLAPLRLDATPGFLDVEQAAAVAIALGALFTAQAMWLLRTHRSASPATGGPGPSLGEDRG